MKPRDRAAGDRDADEGKNRSGEDEPGAVDEARERRHLSVGRITITAIASAATVPSFRNVLR